MVLPKSQPSESAKHKGKRNVLFFNPNYVVEIDSQKDSIMVPTSTEMKSESCFSVT